MPQLKHEGMKTPLNDINHQSTVIKTLTNDVNHEVPPDQDKKGLPRQASLLDRYCSSILFVLVYFVSCLPSFIGVLVAVLWWFNSLNGAFMVSCFNCGMVVLGF